MTAPGRGFETVADLYDEARPVYPDSLYDDIELVAGPLAGAQVLDLASGTGIATRALADRGARVVALDPGEQMLRRLVSRSPAIPAVAAHAEALPFRDAGFDLVTCGTGWHWLRTEPTVAEVRRVLRPNGQLALFWAVNRWGDNFDWEDAQSAVLDQWDLVRGSVPPTQEGVGPSAAAGDLRDRGAKVRLERWVEWERSVTRDAHLRMVRTHSNVLALRARDRDELMSAIEAALAPWPTVVERLWGPLVIACF